MTVYLQLYTAITTIGHLSWTGMAYLWGRCFRISDTVNFVKGGPSVAEFAGKNYLHVLIPMLQKESEPHKLRLVRILDLKQ